ncbi:MAG: hypothetical protein JNM17_36755 [Archangium sp.]|nr:hypothetical protein [Archangium sp.]
MKTEAWTSARVGYGLLAALYVLSFPYHPGLRSPNELCRLWQSRSLIDDGTLSINGVIQRSGMVGDLSCTATVRDATGDRLARCVGPEAPRSGVVAVNYYPSKAPLMSFLGAPVYWVLSKVTSGRVTELAQVFWSRLFLTIAPTLVMLVLLRRFLMAYVAPATADLFVVIYALGTMALTYSLAFMSHQMTAVLLFSAFYFAWRIERGEWKERGYLLVGLLSALAVVAEYTAALGVLCLASWTVASRWPKPPGATALGATGWPELARATGLVIAGSVPALALLMLYHRAAFGSPFVSGYKFLNDAAYMNWHEGGFLGIKMPDARAFGLSYFSPLRGFFALSPFLMASVFGLRDLKAKERALFIFTAVLLGGHAYFTSSFNYDSWGWTVGPRHLTGTLPFLILPAAMVFERLSAAKDWMKAGLVGGLGVSSILATGLVAFVNYVPDDVSTSVFGLAIPVWSDGYWPVSWLAAFIPNPASGVVLAALLFGAVAWAIAVVKQGREAAVVGGVVLALVLHFGILRLFTRSDDHDQAATKFLESVWVAPNGKALEFRAP